MTLLRELVRAEVAVVIAGLGAVTLWKALRAARWLGGLWGSGGLAGRFATDLVRLQACLITVAVALAYWVKALSAAGSGALPRVPWAALILLGLSQGAWVAHEVRRRSQRTRDVLS